MGRPNLRAILHFTFLLGQTILTYCNLVEGSSLGAQVSMAGYHLLAAPLAPARTMLHSRNIDWGCYPQQGAGGRRHSDTTFPESQRPTHGVHQRPVSVPKEQVRVGQGGGVVARGWGSYGAMERCYII